MTASDGPSVRETLEDLAQSPGPVYYFVPNGNAGDALIHLGFHQLARESKLSYTCVTSPEQVPPNSLVIFGGGGGLASEWAQGDGHVPSPSAVNIGRFVDSARRLIIMPQSVNAYQDLLHNMDDRVVLFLREERSFALARQWATGGARVLIDHDTAFSLDALSFLERYAGPRAKMPRDVKDAARLALCQWIKLRGIATKEISAFRADPERREGSPHRSKVYDLSLVASFGHGSISQCEYTAFRFLSLIRPYERVCTDRLHVAIGAALLGKTVTLFDNSYFKCRAVHEYSMARYHVTMGAL